ncbi:uncharacterized protein M421DRAFT_396240 [Didymella exigua CBS 183.55]|uniref:Uncharacterized protein n=1 Tax=Didymella exigua CBS 183.55 TaxID=1150837 RepID=A0A6A5RGW9_9PLEO|nr:uncharacterized protein M421DRAFT_396240 [Didymella exigua CBS 183.55]KAF1926779.1 hypothetical protein M421DRAFT_396240 [Didymella exigua CBS 183.55]
MGNVSVSTTSPTEDVSFAATVEAANTPPTTAAAIDTLTPHGTPPDTVATEREAASPSPRLLDRDLNKFRSLKRVIFIGRPGSGTDGIGDALKKLGFKVYDFQVASSRYERDFPLWLEAARLRQEGRSYNKSDFDKVIGDYDAIVGAPACFFDQDLVKLYPGVKVILVTRDSVIKTNLKTTKAKLWRRFDPVYHGNISRFLKLNAPSNNHDCVNNDRAVRETVRGRNLLEVGNLLAWKPITRAELMARPWQAVLEVAKKTGRQLTVGLTYLITMTSVTLIAALAAIFGGTGLYQLSSAGLHLFHFLAVRSQIRDMTCLAVAGLALLTFEQRRPQEKWWKGPRAAVRQR